MRQRVIRLTDDKNFSRLMAAAARYQNPQTVPRVKRIEDPPLSLLIPGSMSLPRRASEKAGWPEHLATKPVATIGRFSTSAYPACSRTSPWRAVMDAILASCAISAEPTFSSSMIGGLSRSTPPRAMISWKSSKSAMARRSTMITSQLPVTVGTKSSATRRFHDASLLDRLVRRTLALSTAAWSGDSEICQGMPLASCVPVSHPFRSQSNMT